MLSFATGMYNIYHPYARNIRKNLDGTKSAQSENYITISSSLASLFWALFDRQDLEQPDVVIPELPVTVDNVTVNIYNEHRVTESFGYCLFALFNLIGISVFMNMFIAILTEVYKSRGCKMPTRNGNSPVARYTITSVVFRTRHWESHSIYLFN